MKIIIKNDNRDIVKNPNVKIVETTESTFTNQVVILENNDIPIIKYTDTESIYFVKNLDNLYEKSKSEVLLNITTDNLEAIGGSSSTSYLIYTAILSQSGTSAPVATVLENTLGEVPTFEYNGIGDFQINSSLSLFNSETTVVEFQMPDDAPNSLSYGIPSDTFIPLYSNGVNGVIVYAKLEIKVYLTETPILPPLPDPFA